MVATKRVASPRKGRVSKTPRVECTTVLAALAAAEAEGFAAAEAEVLRLAAPYALETPQLERHPYQNAIIQGIETAIAKADAARQGTVAGANAAIEEHAKRVNDTGLELAGAKERATASKEAKEAKRQKAKEAAADAAAAVQGLAAATKKQELHNAEVLTKEQEKETYEKAKGDTWEKLKAAGFLGNQWRTRDREIAKVVQMLQKSGLAAALEVSLETALKQKVDERGPFAAKALEFGDSVWEKYINGLTAEIAGFGVAGAECDASVAEADQTRKEAQGVKTAAANAAMDADNAWADSETKVYELTDFVKKADLRADELRDEFGVALKALESLRELNAGFTALRDRSAESAETDQIEPDIAADAPMVA